MLSKLLKPMSAADFLADYFFTKPVHIRGSKDKFDWLPSYIDLRTLLVGADNLRAVFADLRQADIGPDDALDMFRSGATICMTGIEEATKPLERVARALR